MRLIHTAALLSVQVLVSACVDDLGETDVTREGLTEHSRVTLCHVPGRAENAHTITVGSAAVKAHLAHGDYAGECATACHVEGDACAASSDCIPWASPPRIASASASRLSSLTRALTAALPTRIS